MNVFANLFERVDYHTDFVLEIYRLMALGSCIGIVMVLILLGTGALLKKFNHDILACICFVSAFILPMLEVGAIFIVSHGWCLNPMIWTPTEDVTICCMAFMMGCGFILGLHGMEESFT